MQIRTVITALRAGEEGERLGEFAGRLADLLSADVRQPVNTDLEDEEGTLLVTNEPTHRDNAHVLMLFREADLNNAEGQCVMIPFGSRGSGIEAAKLGIPFAKALRLPVVFYHTTWIEDGRESEDPRGHMCAGALEIEGRLIGMAHDVNVPFRFVVETAKDVYEGIVLAALVERASLIVTARGSSVLTGSYSDRLRSGPTPLLIVGQEVVS